MMLLTRESTVMAEEAREYAEVVLAAILVLIIWSRSDVSSGNVRMNGRVTEDLLMHILMVMCFGLEDGSREGRRVWGAGKPQEEDPVERRERYSGRGRLVNYSESACRGVPEPDVGWREDVNREKENIQEYMENSGWGLMAEVKARNGGMAE